MSEHISPIPSRLYNAAVGGHVCGPEDVDFGQKVVHLVKYDRAGNEVSFESQVTQANKIYVIHDDFTLSSNVTIPANCVLEFDGGSISGAYTLTGTNTKINADLVKIFNTNVTLAGTWNVESAFPEWYGCFPNTNNTVCASTAINKLFTTFKCVELNEGTYLSYTGEPIVIGAQFKGKGTDVSILKFIGYTNGFEAVIFGNKGGDVNHRSWRCGLEGIWIILDEQNKTQTACLVLGASTRSHLFNINVRNQSVRTGEFSSAELETPENYCNYGIVINGAIELMAAIDITSIADIPIYLKNSVDQTHFYSCYLQAGNYGLCGIYGSPLGTNSSIRDLAIAGGLWGIHFVGSNGAAPYLIDNMRIEQLRTLQIGDYNNVGSSIYIDGGNTVYSSFGVICNSVLATSKNGLNLKGNAVITIEDSVTYTPDDVNIDYSVRIEGNNVSFKARRMSGHFSRGKIIAPSSYSVSGFDTPQIYGGANQNPALSDCTIENKNNNDVSSRRFNAINKYTYQSIRYLDYIVEDQSKQWWTVVNSDLINNIQFYIFEAEIFNDTSYKKVRFLVKQERDENGVPTGYLQTPIMLSEEGDDIVSLNTPRANSKFNIYKDGAQLYIRNFYDTVKVILTIKIYSKDIIQR